MGHQNPFAYFSELSKKAIILARDEVVRNRSKFLKPEHLLVGVIEIKDRKALDLLENNGIDENELKYEIQRNQRMGKRDYQKLMKGSGVTVDIHFTKLAAGAINKAFEKRNTEGSEFIEPEHLLQAILELDSRPIKRIVKNVKNVKKTD